MNREKRIAQALQDMRRGVKDDEIRATYGFNSATIAALRKDVYKQKSMEGPAF